MARHGFSLLLVLLAACSAFTEGRELGRLPPEPAPLPKSAYTPKSAPVPKSAYVPKSGPAPKPAPGPKDGPHSDPYKPAPKPAPKDSYTKPAAAPKGHKPAAAPKGPNKPQGTAQTPSYVKSSPSPQKPMGPTYGCPANLGMLTKDGFATCGLNKKGALKDRSACCGQGLISINAALLGSNNGKSTDFKSIIANATVNGMCYKAVGDILKQAGLKLPSGKSDWSQVCPWWFVREYPQPGCKLDTTYRINSKSYITNLHPVCKNDIACMPDKAKACNDAIKKQTDLFGGSKKCGNLVIVRLLEEYYPDTYKVLFNRQYCSPSDAYGPGSAPLPAGPAEAPRPKGSAPTTLPPQGAVSPRPYDAPRPGPAPVPIPANTQYPVAAMSPPPTMSPPPLSPPPVTYMGPVMAPAAAPNTTKSGGLSTDDTPVDVLGTSPPPAAVTPAPKKNSTQHRFANGAVSLAITLLAVIMALF